ncbi:MAG: DEAD/DEAH box helicase family protein [candidate division WOR-3 bacterium]
MGIEKYLVLNKYLLSLFGVEDIRDLLNQLKDKKEGIDSDGRSYFVNALIGSQNLNISDYTLLEYDKNIQEYLRKINSKREQITLKYFQYLAVLFTEIVLDNLKNRKNEFLQNLNHFLVEDYKQKHSIDIIDKFTENDLKKLAFWMATGAGKTLIMHINYHQFFKYELFPPDNIILITPNEGLSKQHFEELQKSGIPCRLYLGDLNGSSKNNKEVLIIEITKLVEEKKGRGKTLPVKAFEGKNLLFVDEGHKGRRSEEQKWAKLRDKLAKDGFVFEYSATFGQILNERQRETLEIYAKSIVFDYSYKYFYLDGYGKDFSVINIRQNLTEIKEEDFQEMMFVANLLSFYEQLLAYEENKHLAKELNIEKPLWIFVGTTVTGREEESDVIQIVDFIKRVLSDEKWLKGWIDRIFKGNTGLKDERGKDIFENKFVYLKKRFELENLYRMVFGGKGGLELYELKNAEGEIGLKVGENHYFGVINIGNVSEFKKELEKKRITVGQDAISHSLFDDIKKEDSKINILIGSKKFIEGWDTWRVSSMGLLNIGKGQGPQIIQLFGRGVRLKGKGMSLKRSAGKPEIRLLETLNIYSIKADYLNRFLEAIRNEEVEFETIEVPVKFQHEDKWKNLYILSKPERSFEEEKVLKLSIDNTISYTVDLLPKVLMYSAEKREEAGIKGQQIRPESQEIRFTEDIVNLLDWERIWKEIIEFKTQRQYWNLVFDVSSLKKILLSDRYKIFSSQEIMKITNDDDMRHLEDIAILVIKRYIDLFYKKSAKRFETENLRYDNLKQVPFDNYIVKIKKHDNNLVNAIRNLIEDLDKLVKEETEILPRVYFEGSLYLPLLLESKGKGESKEIDKISPPGLVESEEKFVRGLREYLKRYKEKINAEIYLLRNLPFSGIGFQLQWSTFYPDFIMWIKEEEQQTIVFVDPKGLEHARGLDDEKIQFRNELKELEQKLGNDKVVLDSFILSITPYENLIRQRNNPPSKDEFMEHNVLFLEDEDWTERLFNRLTAK